MESDIQGDRGSMRSDIQGDRGSMESDVQSDRGSMESDIQGDRGSMESDIQGDRRSMESDIQKNIFKIFVGFLCYNKTHKYIIYLTLKKKYDRVLLFKMAGAYPIFQWIF